MRDSYDIIVIGAGSAGCVLANRLSADAGRQVLLIEAGGRGRNPLIRVPIMTGTLLRGRAYNWFYHTEPQAELNGRRIFWPRGKVLGGSSAINGMVYARGLPSDYDAWAQRGLGGWSYDEVLPYFLRSERYLGPVRPHHGREGTMAVTPAEAGHPLYRAFLQAGEGAGFPATDDFNGPAPEGFGRHAFTIGQGRRCSSADAFLRPAEGRANLSVAVNTRVLRLIVEGSRARAVELLQDGRARRIRAEREIVLACGSINSPALLLRSGIGAPDALGPLGIEVRHPLPGVGRNLQDHLLVRVQQACTQPVSLYRLRRLDRALAAVLEALLLRRGPATRFPLEAGAFLRSDPALSEPDLQVNFLPGLSTASLRLPFLGTAGTYDRHGFLLNAYPMRPQSRGHIGLRSADPLAAPLIQPGYLSAEADRSATCRAVAIMREILAQPAFDPFRGVELAPGPDVRSDEEILAWVRATAETAYHPVGTCRMGRDEEAVVDERLRVRGLEGLRVADASVMPTLTSANTHAPTVMIAEKAADMIRAEA